jgi:hypothetical protein
MFMLSMSTLPVTTIMKKASQLSTKRDWRKGILHLSSFLAITLDAIYDQIQQQPLNVEEEKHFTDLVRYLFCSVPHLILEERLDTQYCATKLDNAGLKFEAAKKKALASDKTPSKLLSVLRLLMPPCFLTMLEMLSVLGEYAVLVYLGSPTLRDWRLY